MTKIILYGACGRMGKAMETLVSASDSYEIVARIDKMANEPGVLRNPDDFGGEADVIVDFSHHLATKDLLNYAVHRGLPTVIATTGHTEEEEAMIANAAKNVPIFHSANMSLGVALLIELAVKTASVMPDADIEIVETHHNRKLDAPSGTALMIANAIKNVREKALIKLGRSGKAVREKDEIGIHAVRRGNVVGIHEVLVSTDCQTITLKHEAHSRALFAEGALSAVSFLRNQKPGLYDMNSIIDQKEG
ncbi:MAG: 4-hydroxy-tetrahydrodipicolinate reductase [Clostridia bacterium]|nr:4-hydroxy-tetrahydrodipicolinate reductase [Clostridia bacterium]